MHLRDAVERDAEWMTALTGRPADVTRNLIHDRTVRVAVTGEEDEEEDALGFVAYDARRETVHVTQIQGTTEACRELLEAPLGFAASEGMSVELLLAVDDELREVVASKGFEEVGEGPRFDGTQTIRYRR
ncbi:MAG: hypothetical protein U5K28_08245 [Halobacteriales archaeon]|nr:hypothetical protein [Halobacteriales archaeon]